MYYSQDELRQQANELGKALAALHTVELPQAGLHDPKTDSIKPFETTYADYVEATIEELLAKSVAASPATSADDVTWARSVASEGRAAMEMLFQPAVVHLDFGFHNALWQVFDGAWTVTGLIDWMTAEAGHPECDLSRPLATFQHFGLPGRGEFLAAYREGQPEQPGFAQRFPVFMLWERLLIWSYWQAHNGFEQGLGMRTWIEPYVGTTI